MKTLNYHKKYNMGLAFLALLSFGLIGHHPAHALTTPNESTSSSTVATAITSAALENKTPENTFVYEIEGRPDPFVPFITKKATSANMDEIVPIVEQLTGMQLFEPGQLSLVAIVMAADSNFAMAEDFTGKGYILQAGMQIGRRGIVTAIKQNQVIIEETAVTRAGKKLTSNIVMLLKKEGEE